MGQRVDQIEDSIQSSREELRSNLDKLGKKVTAAVDWRENFHLILEPYLRSRSAVAL